MTIDRTKSWSRQRAAMKRTMDRQLKREPFSETAPRYAAYLARRVIRRNRIIGWAFAVFPLAAIGLFVWKLLR